MIQEINQCEEAFLEAIRTLNIEVLEELIHDDLIYNNPSGDIMNKEMDLKFAKSGNIIVDSCSCLEREIKLFDNTAIVSTVIHLKASVMGNQVDGNTRFLRTWKKFEDGWKIIGAASIALK